jgi:hypothetical protein
VHESATLGKNIAIIEANMCRYAEDWLMREYCSSTKQQRRQNRLSSDVRYSIRLAISRTET